MRFAKRRDFGPLQMKIKSQHREHPSRVQNVVGSAVRTEILVLMIAFFVAPLLHAQQNTDELRDLTRNPVGDAIKLPFVESINFAAGPYDRTSNSLQAPHELGATDPTIRSSP